MVDTFEKELAKLLQNALGVAEKLAFMASTLRADPKQNEAYDRATRATSLMHLTMMELHALTMAYMVATRDEFETLAGMHPLTMSYMAATRDEFEAYIAERSERQGDE